MLIKKTLRNVVTVTFVNDEVSKITSMSRLANQTDVMSTDDYIRIHLRNAQDQLDNFPECTSDG